jgi:NAD(P)-dependent dehydrogenase (short-subunit alcohol dehydrogenase family)
MSEAIESENCMNRFDVRGRKAVVTGAASGLGRGFCLVLGEAGASVIGVDRDADGLAQTMEIAHAKGYPMSSIIADVADAQAVDTMYARITSDSDTVDILVNNAGIATVPGRTHEIAVADWDRALAVNLRSMFLVTRVLLPLMMSSRSGSIINLSSFLGLVGLYPGFSITAIPYAASKAGVVGLTRQIAIEYAAEGIRANAIAPGWHGGTNLGRERRATATAEEGKRFEAFIAGSVPMQRRGTPDDLCGLLLYLASDASKYMTGQVFAHDGGITAA